MQRLLRYYQNYGSIHNVEVATESEKTNKNHANPYTAAPMNIREQRDAVATTGSEYYICISPASTTNTSPASSLGPTEESSSCQDTTHDYSDTRSTGRKLPKRNSTPADIRLSMVSNFSAAYNTINISLALALMQSVYPPADSSDITTCSSALIAGMILGQLGGGLLGDWLGRHMAMAMVMSLQVGAAFFSAWSGIMVGTSGTRNVYTELAGWRFLLGVGCGGVYPLAATITAESSSKKEKNVALTFSMQGVGYLAVSLVAYSLTRQFGEKSDLAWRLLLGLGSLPGLMLIASRIYRRKVASVISPRSITQPHPSQQATQEVIASASQHDVETELLGEVDKLSDFNKLQKQAQIRLKPTSLIEQICNEPNLSHKLIGTAGCWLLFDIIFYGNALFQPVVLSAAFGESETILDISRDSIFISLMALPGYFVSVAMVGRQSLKRIQLQGFMCMAVLYTIIGVKFGSLNRFSLLGLYGLTFFFSNYGPNTTVCAWNICFTKYNYDLRLICFSKTTDFYAPKHDLLTSMSIHS
mmetsp:Transcript_30377/g.56102  ORF Transcript_30377/g.56102 Transcript_30377/m.56102 type:complete len:529 (-) Transcript_30377:409-1995(-)